MKTIISKFNIYKIIDILNSLSKHDKPMVYVGTNFRFIFETGEQKDLKLLYDDGRVLNINMSKEDSTITFFRVDSDYKCVFRTNSEKGGLFSFDYIDKNIDLTVNPYTMHNAIIISEDTVYRLSDNRIITNCYTYGKDDKGNLFRRINKVSEDSIISKTTNKEWLVQTRRQLLENFDKNRNCLNPLLDEFISTNIKNTLGSSFKTMINDYNSSFMADYNTIKSLFKVWDNLFDNISKVSFTKEELESINNVLKSNDVSICNDIVSKDFLCKLVNEIKENNTNISIDNHLFKIEMRDDFIKLDTIDGRRLFLRCEKSNDNVIGHLTLSFGYSYLKYDFVVGNFSCNSEFTRDILIPREKVFHFLNDNGNTTNVSMAGNRVLVSLNNEDYVIEGNEIKTKNYTYMIDSNDKFSFSENDSFNSGLLHNLEEFDTESEVHKIINGCFSNGVDDFVKNMALENSKFYKSLYDAIDEYKNKMSNLLKPKDEIFIRSIYDIKTVMSKEMGDLSFTKSEESSILDFISSYKTPEGNKQFVYTSGNSTFNNK